MNKGSDTALFPRRTKVAMEMKNRTIWVCVRGRNKGGIKDELGWFCFASTGRMVATFAELRNTGKGKGEEK